jgi:hypothetical protein
MAPPRAEKATQFNRLPKIRFLVKRYVFTIKSKTACGLDGKHGKHGRGRR